MLKGTVGCIKDKTKLNKENAKRFSSVDYLKTNALFGIDIISVLSFRPDL